MATGDDSYDAPLGSGMFPGQKEEEDAVEAAEMGEVELMRVFKTFDADGSGSIDAEELRMAMTTMGIKVTMSSVRKILKVIDTDGSGTIEWEEFYEFFQKVKSPDEFKKLLGAQNAAYLDYKMMVKEDPNFERRFFIPPSVNFSKKFMGHEDNVEDVKWIPGTNSYVSVSLDGYIKTWDVNTGKCSKTIEYKEAPNIGMYCVTLCDPGVNQKVMVGLGRRDAGVAMYDLAGAADQSPVMQWNKTGAPAYSIGIHPDKTKFIMGNKQGTLMYYDLTKPDPLCELQAHEGVVYSAEWNKESSMIATASSDGLIHLTDLRSAAQMVVNRTVEDAAAAGVCYQALWKGEYELLSCGDDYCMKKWDIRALKSGTVENYFGHTSPVRAICLSPCEKYAGTAANDGCIRVWSVDERDRIIDTLQGVDGELDAPEAEREKLEAALKAEQEKDFDPESDKMGELSDKLFTKVQELAEIYGRRKFYDHVRQERSNMNCVQASLGCDGHSLTVSSLSWRSLDGGKGQIITGCQDQTSLLFDFDEPNVNDFVRWGKELEGVPGMEGEGGYGA